MKSIEVEELNVKKGTYDISKKKKRKLIQSRSKVSGYFVKFVIDDGEEKDKCNYYKSDISCD